MSRRSTSWWDNLVIPEGTGDAFAYLMSIMPSASEHDYTLYTDGSGCIKGWGANAAVIRFNEDNTHDIRLSANFGQTVQRNELTAMLDGLHGILDHRVRKVIQEGLDELPPNPLNYFQGENRITVLWYTDRQNLAKSLLFDEYGKPLNGRNNERDLWMRFSAMAKCFCITPVHTSRNTVPLQALCDELCTIGREALKRMAPALTLVTPSTILSNWDTQRPQAAVV